MSFNWNRAGSDTIDGATSVVISAQNKVYALVSNGVDRWNVIVEPVTIADATTSVKGIIEIATNAEFFAGTDTDKAIVPSNFVRDLNADGYARIGPLILQWGQTGAFTTSTSVLFELVFPTACLQAYCGTASALTSVTNIPATVSLSTTGFTILSGSSASVAYRWWAIGY